MHLQLPNQSCHSLWYSSTPSTIEELNVALEGEGQADWVMAANFVEEYALAAKISKAKALEPCTLAKAKHCPNRPLCKKAIHEELETIQKAGT